ncbi:unnamed protein product, partial [Allacma fusca]
MMGFPGVLMGILMRTLAMIVTHKEKNKKKRGQLKNVMSWVELKSQPHATRLQIRLGRPELSDV